MKRKYRAWGRLSMVGGVLTSLVVSSNSVLAAMLEAWRFDPQSNQLEFTLEESSTPSYFVLSSPPRIVIDLPNTDLGTVETEQQYPGLVRQVRLSQFTEEATRVVVELSEDVALSPQQVQLQKLASSDTKNTWVLRPLIAKTNDSPSLASGNRLPQNTSDNPQNIMVTVPPLEAREATTTPNEPFNIPVIEFGQQLLMNDER